MYINKPMIKMERVGHVIDLKKKNLNSSEYLVHIIRELQDIENKWAKLLKNSDAEIQRAKKQKIGIEDDVAYTRCVALLDEEYETQEEKISKTRRKMKVAVQSAQEHIQLCQNQKRQRAEEIQKLRVEIEELENEETNFGKKVKRKYEIRQKIDEYKKEIEASSVRLQAAKQKSYEQRNLYVETQQVQLKLEGSLNKIEGDEKAYYQVRNRQEKYRKLSRMIQKLNSKTQGGNYDVQSYLKEKISAIAHLSSTLMSLQEKHKQYNTSIEEQVFVIEGMQRRLNQNIEIDDDVVKTYQDKYQKLYLSKNNGINSWKNYKSYLQEVLKRDQIQPTLNYQTQKRNPRGTFSHYEPQTTFSLRRNQSSLTKSPQTNSHFVRKYSNLRTQPHLSQIQEQQEDARSHNLTYQQSPIHRFNGYLPNEISADIVRLPKLGRSNVKTSLQTGKIKDNTRKLANQSFVSVVSENSEDEMSGSFVDINYNRK